MNGPAGDELQEARRPIASLISKSEKAQQKLSPGTWQHSMLRDHLAALRLASSLLGGGAGEAVDHTDDQLRSCIDQFESMIQRTEGARPRFAPGSPQHALLRNRLKALRTAQALIRAVLEGRKAPPPAGTASTDAAAGPTR